MRCTVLGPISVDGDVPRSPLERRLLAALLVSRGTQVSSDALCDVVWEGEPPRSATNALQSKISRLRPRLGASHLRRVGAGYVLELERHACDADRFVDLLESADGVEPVAAVGRLDEALALWAGPAFSEFAHEEFARARAVALDERRRSAEDRRLQALLAAGMMDRVIDSTPSLIDADPFRESTWAARMTALARTGRTIEATRCFRTARERFIDETGVPPSPVLETLAHQILAGEIGPDSAGSGPARTADMPRSSTPVAGIDPVPPPARRSIGGPLRRSELVGRSGERAQLAAAWEVARAGDSRFVSVSGPIGIGKSRLIDGLAAEVASLGGRVISARCLSASAHPLGPFGQLAAALGIDAVDGGPLERFTADMLASHAGTMSLALQCLDELARRPTLVTIDDAQWIGLAAAQALDGLLAEVEGPARRGGCPVMIVLAHRPLDPTDGAHALLDRCRRGSASVCVDLQSLDEAAVAALAASATGVRPSGATARELHRASGGVPLLAATLLDHWATTGGLGAEAGRLTVSADAEPMAPASVEHVLHERWSQLDDESRRCLHVLAISPLLGTLTLGELAQVLATTLRTSPAEVMASFDSIEAAGFISHSHRPEFANPRVRGFANAQLTRRAQMEVATALVASLTQPDPNGSSVAERHPTLVVDAMRAAADVGAPEPVERIVEWGLAAAEQSWDAGDWAAVVSHLGLAASASADSLDARAGSRGPRLPIELLDGLARFRAHDEHSAQALLLDAGAQAAEQGDAQLAALAFTIVHRIAISFPLVELPIDAAASRRMCSDFLAEHGAAAGGAGVRLAAVLVEDAAVRVDVDGGTELLERVATWPRPATASPADDQAPELDFAAGLLAMSTLDMSVAQDRFERALDGATALPDRWVASWCAGRLAWVISMTEPDRADELLTDAVERQRAIHIWSELALSRALQASARSADGDSEGALALVDESERLALRSGYPFGQMIALPVAALEYARLGRRADALEVLDRLSELTGRPGVAFRILVDVTTGHVDDAVDVATAAAERLRQPLTLERVPTLIAVHEAARRRQEPSLLAAVDSVRSTIAEAGIVRHPAWPIADLNSLGAHHHATTPHRVVPR